MRTNAPIVTPPPLTSRTATWCRPEERAESSLEITRNACRALWQVVPSLASDNVALKCPVSADEPFGIGRRREEASARPELCKRPGAVAVESREREAMYRE